MIDCQKKNWQRRGDEVMRLSTFTGQKGLDPAIEPGKSCLLLGNSYYFSLRNNKRSSLEKEQINQNSLSKKNSALTTTSGVYTTLPF